MHILKFPELEEPNYLAGALKKAIKTGKRGSEIAVDLERAKDDRKISK